MILAVPAIMSFKSKTLAALRAARSQPTAKKSALVGFDGFVDTIVVPVSRRNGLGDDFTSIATIPEFAQRVAGAAGKSTNIELYPQMIKLGGNGPIMAYALLSAGTRLTYVGALGKPAVHPVFHDLAKRADVISLCNPGMTTAIEFNDGKLILGQISSLDEISLDVIDAAMGKENFRECLARTDMIALVNWTMIPQMSAILRQLTDEVLPAIPPNPDRIYFFDLADPEKRSGEDLLEALAIISRFRKFGRVTLGLNLKEAQRVYQELGFATRGESEQDLRTIAADLREKLGLTTVVVHPRESAACATEDGTFWVPGPYAEKPLITTGAGDHFNAGFTQGQLLGLDPEACLCLGVCTSGHYVRTAESPNLDQLETFLGNWD